MKHSANTSTRSAQAGAREGQRNVPSLRRLLNEEKITVSVIVL
jgi:hypothetical protein